MIFIRLPTKIYMKSFYRGVIYVSFHAWSSQKMPDPLNIPQFDAPLAPSDKPSPSKQVLPDGKAAWNQANIIFHPHSTVVPD